MAHPEAGRGEGEGAGERYDERFLLNKLPSPARVMHIRERRTSFFIVYKTYTASGIAQAASTLFPGQGGFPTCP